MMKNVFFVKFILLIIIVTNATAYDTCLSPRTKDQDCDCDILTNGAEGWSIGGRAKGAMIEFAISHSACPQRVPQAVLRFRLHRAGALDGSVLDSTWLTTCSNGDDPSSAWRILMK